MHTRGIMYQFYHCAVIVKHSLQKINDSMVRHPNMWPVLSWCQKPQKLISLQNSIVLFPDPTTHARKGSGDIAGIFLVVRTITWPHVLQYKPIQIITWLPSLQNQESTPMSPVPFLLWGWVWGQDYTHRLQLFLNLWDSPEFLSIIQHPGRLYYNFRSYL